MFGTDELLFRIYLRHEEITDSRKQFVIIFLLFAFSIRACLLIFYSEMNFLKKSMVPQNKLYIGIINVNM